MTQDSDWKTAPDPHACAVCGRSLNWWEPEDGTDGRWIHAPLPDEEGDHPPVPVPTSEIGQQHKPVCDFCTGEQPTWILPVRPFVAAVVQADGVQTEHGSAADWSACDDCAKLLERDEWNALARRSRTFWENTNGPMPEPVFSALKAMHRRVRANITGSLRRN